MPHSERVKSFSLTRLDGKIWQFTQESRTKPVLLVFFETDCPTCRLTLPYLNRLTQTLGKDSESVIGISQDGVEATRRLLKQIPVQFPVFIDRELKVSEVFDPPAVPALFILDRSGQIVHSEIGFQKRGLNAIASVMTSAFGLAGITIAQAYDGAPDSKPGCSSRHLQRRVHGNRLKAVDLHVRGGVRASQIQLDEDMDPYEYCVQEGFSDFLPVVPPTLERVEAMSQATSQPPQEVIGFVPPCYGQATVEKIAANAVMAGCRPQMMRVLIPIIRAACDEKFNLHGVQATTHFAAPLIIVNGPVRRQLHFASASNVFSNVARSNSTLGRALQLILVNLGGARPGEIDMSTLGNPGKFSYCIAENEEANPWEPLHVELGFKAEQSTITLFAAEPPRGVSEHTARRGRQILKTISRTLVTIGNYRVCAGLEALVVFSPEHVKTLNRDGFSKRDVREFLFENTGVPIKEYEDDGSEGTQYQKFYEKILIDGEPSYRKFQDPGQIKIMVAGGTAGKFSAIIGSWASGPRGSQMVTYPVGEGVS